MRTRLRKKSRFQGKFAAGFAAAVFAGAAAGIFYAVPGLAGCAAGTGILAAGMVLPEGGLAVLRGQAEEVSVPEPLPEPETLLELPVPPALREPAEPAESVLPEAERPEPPPEISVPEPEVAEENRAELVHKTYQVSASNIFLPLKHGYLKNCTKIPRAEIEAQVQKPPYFTIADTDAPQVLIYHTHTTESYVPFTGAYYDRRMSFRSTDNSKNMAAVGDRIAAELEAAGIGVIHDVFQHDYPAYNGSYSRSQKTIEKYLAEYPTIKVVLDIHRDAIASGSQVYSAEAEIDGKTAAQVMIISGCDDGTMGYPNYMQNLSFAAALQNQLEGDYPSLMRPILFDYRKYNQQLSSGGLLLEVGSHGNTLEQAMYSGELIGKSLGRLLNSLKQ